MLYIHQIYYILATNLKVFSRTVIDKLIDLFIWVVATAAVTIYLLPFFGLDHSYGAFAIASIAGSAGLFEQFSSCTQLVADFEGSNITSFYFTLPLPSWLVWVAYMSFYFINTMVLCIGVIPICKLLFWNHFNVMHMSIIKYTIVLALTSLFNAAFTLWLAAMVPNLERIGSMWMRFVFPLWTFGGFQYSYKVLAQLSPLFAYASLLNPQLYIMEGTRAAVLGQEGSLNFWLCVGMIFIFSILCAFHAIVMLKKRLDYV